MTATKFWHSMLRVSNPDETIAFFKLLGLEEVERYESQEGRFTLYFLAVPGNEEAAQIELTHNWDEVGYGSGRNFGHLCFYVDDIYRTCDCLAQAGVTINRPPRDGSMAFIKTPDDISIELIQAERKKLPLQEPWLSMPNTGTW